MPRPRIIPVLLLQGNVLVKSVAFKNYKYIGDPINAVRIFNDLKADELVFLDINASMENRLIDAEFVSQVGEEANMPFSVGGGIRTLEDIRILINAGAERVIINAAAIARPAFIREAADEFGSSTITVCMDVKKKLFGGQMVWSNNGKKATSLHPVDYAKQIESLGAGEIIVQCIDKDGAMTGYDLPLIRSISEAVTIPVTALGGAGSTDDLEKAHNEAFANGLAAGSLFVFHGKNRGVLITYPKRS
jgi:cyclase